MTEVTECPLFSYSSTTGFITMRWLLVPIAWTKRTWWEIEIGIREASTRRGSLFLFKIIFMLFSLTMFF